MQRHDARSQVQMVHLLKSGLLEHALERVLVRMHADRFGEITVARAVTRDADVLLYLLVQRAARYHDNYSSEHALLCAVVCAMCAEQLRCSEAETQALLCAALTVSACGNLGKLETAPPTVAAPKPSRTVAQTPASEREHERILASYGGAYDDPRLATLIGKTVDRLVAASDRPDPA